MTTLQINTTCMGNYDLLTDEHSAASYGRPVLVHNGVAYGPGDIIPDNLFGDYPAHESATDTMGLLTVEQLAMLNKWREDCARVSGQA